MRNLPGAALLILLCGLPVPVSAQSVALSFDDGLDPRQQPEAAVWNASILQSLSKARLSTILFAAGKRVDSETGLKLVKDWGQAGHAVANHTYSHLNFGSDKTTLEQFIADVERNETLLHGMPGWTRRLRFPYLKEGETAAKRDGARAWMAGHGYRTGAVSIDASDWYYDTRYRAWLKQHPGEDPARFRAAYLDHLWSRAIYYDSLAQRVLHRRVRHVLLLHTNAINAAFLSDVIAMFRSKGWELIAPEAAWEDALYAMTPPTLPAGESILWSLAKQNGIEDLRYPAEDAIYEKPLLDKLGL